MILEAILPLDMGGVCLIEGILRVKGSKYLSEPQGDCINRAVLSITVDYDTCIENLNNHEINKLINILFSKFYGDRR